MEKIKKFLWYFLRNPYFTVAYILEINNKLYTVETNIVPEQELLNKIESGISLIRFGDGDVYIAHGGDQSYQESSRDLRKKLFKIFSSTQSCEYSLEKAPYIIGIPSRYLKETNKSLRDSGILKCWLPFKVVFNQFFNKKALYFDAHLFYQGKSFEKYIIPSLRNKNVIFVSNMKNIEIIKRQSFITQVSPHYIETSENNSFSEYQSIYDKIVIHKSLYKDLRVILATGTTSKVLAYELSTSGIVCYDIGWGIMYTEGENELEEQLIS